MADPQPQQQERLAPRRLIGLLVGPLAAAAIALSPPPEGLSQEGWWIAAAGVWMAVWWMTEALPLAATALLPLILFPLLGIRAIETTAHSYADPLIFLFFGGFLLARAVHVWGLDRRLALAVLRHVGSNPRSVIAGLMAVTAFLSMWVSNTATAMMMLPIGQSILVTIEGQRTEQVGSVAPALLLGIAYGATIGGMGTIIGTPPNALFAAFMAQSYGIEIGFFRWMLVGVPLLLVLLTTAWLVLTRVAFRIAGQGTLETAAAIHEKHAALGPASRAERMLAAVLVLVAAGWVFRPLLQAALPGLHLSDAGIAVAGALLLFVLPVELRRGRFLLSWSEASQIRWDVLILFGGGLALAAAIGASDLGGWLGGRLGGLGGLPLIVVLLALGAVIVMFGELASNTAVAAVFLPVAGAAAVAIGEPAITLALPVALFATLGFMLPVATPPNAVIFGSGAVEMRHMLRAGALLDPAGIVVVALGVLTLGRWIFGAA